MLNLTFSKRKKTLLTLLLGNALEFYDLGLYGFLAPTMAHLFFPVHDHYIQSLISMGIFAIAFISRPIGACIFGYIGDFFGRKTSVSYTMLLMVLPTLVIGILPTYQSIGVMAPILLLICRMIQGISTGGEFSSASIFILEQVNPNKRGFYSGCMTASSICGFFLSSLICFLITFLPFSPNWTWRIPYLLGVFIGILGLYLRRHGLSENVQFQKQSGPIFSRILLTSHAKSLLITTLASWFGGTFTLLLIVYLPSYLNSIALLSPTQITLITNINLLIFMILLPIAGHLSDKFPVYIPMRASAILTLFLAYLLFFLLSKELFYVVLGELLLIMLAIFFSGPVHAYTLGLFPRHFRCRGISLPFTIGVGVLGGTGPMISTFLMGQFGYQGPAMYLSLTAIAGIIATTWRVSNFEEAKNLVMQH